MELTAPIILTKRDVDVIVMVYLFGGCTITHVARRLFSTLKSPRVSYRRVAGLVQQGYLLGRRLPSSSGVGSGRNFLTVGPKGKPVVALALGLSGSDLTRSRMDSPRFIEHHLAICDTRVAMELAVERSERFTLAEWTRDREVEITVTREGNRLLLIPDGAFTLALPGGSRQRFLLEQDMGTMTSSKRMRERLAGYLIALRDSPMPVLFVTTTQQRLAAVAALALEVAQQLGATPGVFWLTTNEQLTHDTALDAPVWRVPGLASPLSLTSGVMVSGQPGDMFPTSPQQPSKALQEALRMPEPVTTSPAGGYLP